MRELLPAYVWIEETVAGAYLPPILYKRPEDGWLAWLPRLASGKQSNPGTVSGNKDESAAPGYAQLIALKAALLGIESPDDAAMSQIVKPDKVQVAAQIIDWDRLLEARETRAAFEQGAAIPLVCITSKERYTSFVPVLRYDANGNYVAGNGDGAQQAITAGDHIQAFDKAIEWYNPPAKRDPSGTKGVRNVEIASRMQTANKAANKVPPIYLDLAVLQLEYDGLLYTQDGDITAMLNGGHGYYLVCANNWCYTLSVSAGPTAKLAILSAIEDKAKLHLIVQDFPVFAGLEGWQGDGADGYQWEGGKMQSVQSSLWRLSFKGQAKAAALVQVNEKGVDLIGPGKKALLSSPVPASWKEEGPGPLLAWAAWRMARRLREEK